MEIEMTLNIKIENSVKATSISVEVEETDSVGDIIAIASQYWNNETITYVMKFGNKLLTASMSIGELGLKNGDTLVLVPDPQGG